LAGGEVVHEKAMQFFWGVFWDLFGVLDGTSHWKEPLTGNKRVLDFNYSAGVERAACKSLQTMVVGKETMLPVIYSKT